ncbi:MAG TPA: ferritin-like domain-containing protein [Terriglobales bacterium]|nr:ferritin-like domain-containing protein [Terriglobales bacterium]
MPQFIQDVEEIRRRARRKIDEGPVTSTYSLDKDQTIGLLNDALATEIVCVLRYMHHYFMATGVHGAAARDTFKEHADEEREHADRFADRIQQLGGKPDFNPRGLLERSVSHYVEGETLADMIREDLVAERVVIDVYRDMIKHFGDKDPTTRVMIEDVLADEEEHANDLADLLYVVNPRTGETEEEDPGTEIGRNDTEERMDRGRSASRGNQSDEPYMEKADRGGGRRDRSEARPARGTGEERPGAGRPDVPPAHAPGTTGRVMARRGRSSEELADEDIAVGGQTGSNRSPKVINKNRKNRAA